MTGDQIAHGTTYAAAMACWRKYGEWCDGCRAVATAYDRELKRSDPYKRSRFWYAELRRLRKGVGTRG